MTSGRAPTDHAWVPISPPIEVLFAFVTFVTAVLALYGASRDR